MRDRAHASTLGAWFDHHLYSLVASFGRFGLFVAGPYELESLEAWVEHTHRYYPWRSKERIRDRLAAWKDAARNGHVGTILLGGADKESLRVVAEAVL